MKAVRLGAVAAMVLGPGCHLLDNLEIDCTAGMPCADGETGSGDDTSPTDGPTMGFILSMYTEGSARVEVRAADGEEINAWENIQASFPDLGAANDGRYAGSVAFNPSTQAGVVAAGGAFAALAPDGGINVTASVPDVTVYDIDVATGHAWLAVGTNYVSFDYTSGLTPLLSDGYGTVRSSTLAGPTVFTTDCSDGKPDLFAFDAATGAQVDHGVDFAGDCGFGDNVFAGPDAEPWQCRSDGALFRIADLAGGDSAPFAAPSGFSDVRDCAFDPGDSSFLLLDGARGLYRLTPDGVLTRVWEAPTGYSVARANFFPPG